MRDRVLRCESCDEFLMTLRMAGTGDLVVEYECILDGISHIHPLTVRNAEGVTIAEWPLGIGIGRPTIFDEDAWAQALARP